MSAIIIPFPRVRDVRFIHRHALRMAQLPPPTAEKHLAHQLNIQCGKMAERGINTEVIAEHRHALEAAIRCALWRIVIFRGGAA